MRDTNGTINCPRCGAANLVSNLETRGHCYKCKLGIQLIINRKVASKIREEVMKLEFKDHWMKCPYCGIWQKDAFLRERNERCCTCKKLIPISEATVDESINKEVEMELETMRTKMSNNELGQTLSTLDLLASYKGSCDNPVTDALANLKLFLSIELGSRRRLESQRIARENRDNVIREIADWVNGAVIAETIVEAMEDRGEEISASAVSQVWMECLNDLDEFVEKTMEGR